MAAVVADELVGFNPLLIADARCKSCGLCVAACPRGALALDEGRVNGRGYHPAALVHAGSCTSCVLCARVCPEAAFTVFARPRAARPAR